MQNVDHSNIIKLVDVFESSHHIYMVMELVSARLDGLNMRCGV